MEQMKNRILSVEHDRILSVEHGFEAPEKRLAIGFCRDIRNNTPSLVWEAVVRAAGTTIVSKHSTEFLDSYILAESSLFVWSDQILLLTCGNGILLNAIDEILAAFGGKEEISFFTYQRKSLLFPEFNLLDFGAEVDFITARILGESYTISVGRDHDLHFFVGDHEKKSGAALPEFQVMMYNLSPACEKLFSGHFNSTADEVLQRSGIKKCLPDMLHSPCLFSPQGFSLNSVLHGDYATLHVTPQPPCSYAGFETSLSPALFGRHLNDLIDIFSPRSFILMMRRRQKSRGAGICTVRLPCYLSVFQSTHSLGKDTGIDLSKYVFLDR